MEEFIMTLKLIMSFGMKIIKNVFDCFSIDLLDSDLSFTGHIGDKNKNISSCSIDFVTYDVNDNEIETFTNEIEDTSNINLIFNPTLEFESYSFKLYVKDYVLYQSDLTEFYTGPRLEFVEQYLSSDGLVVICTNISTNSTGYIKDNNNNQIALVFYDDYFIIPLYDSLGNRYNYPNYKLYIDGHSYILDVDKSLISVNLFSVYNINGEIYIHCTGYLSLYSNSARLKTTIIALGSEVATFTFDNDTTSYHLDSSSLSKEVSYLSFICVAVDENDNEVSEHVNQSSIPFTDNIDISTNQNDKEFTLDLSSSYSLNYSVELLYYTDQNQLIKSEFVTSNDIENDNGIKKKQYTATLPDNTSSVIYRLFYNNELICTS